MPETTHKTVVDGRLHVMPWFFPVRAHLRPEVLAAFERMDPESATDLLFAAFQASVADVQDRIQRAYGHDGGAQSLMTRIAE